MQVYGDGVVTAHHAGRGCREFGSGLTSLVMIAPSAEQIKDM
jgi:hypothetical protein